jgi:hypothetical protein
MLNYVYIIPALKIQGIYCNIIFASLEIALVATIKANNSQMFV